MNITHTAVRFIFPFLLVASACSDDDAKSDTGWSEEEAGGFGEVVAADPGLSCAEDAGVVIETPDTYPAYKEWGFDRYTEVVAPNGGSIKIFAAADVGDEMVMRARNVLRFFLTDVPGSTYGADKSEVANQMASNGATLMLPGGAHEEGEEPPFDAQPLFQDEMTVEGGDWYMSNDWDHRDATFEEIFHLVHDMGIGTYMPGALPEYQSALKTEALASLEDGRWGIPIDPEVGDWIEELAEEDSLAQEYIASVIDSYYGYWGAFDEPGGMWGIYIAQNRDEITEKDPRGQALLEAFLPPMAHYEARLASSFEGIFEMSFNAGLSYTHKSQYLVAVTLTGMNDSSITGNASNNLLRGNPANNTLDGGAGEDTVIYCHPREAYTFLADGPTLIVQGPDGSDTLLNIEQVYFADGTVSVATLTE
jgi:hypothetical protein